MKKILLFIIFCTWLQNVYTYNLNLTTCCSETLAYCPPCCGVARTFLSTRPVYRNIAAQQSVWHDMIFNACNPENFAFQAVPIFQKSLRSRSIARYFLFDDAPCGDEDKDFLVVKGDAVIAGNQYSRDIRAEWLNLPSNFAGSFTVKPKQEQFGLWMEAYYSLRSFFETEFLKGFWLGVALPLHYVKNSINLVEFPDRTEPEMRPIAATSITQALSNPAWNFAKFGPSKKLFSVAELDFKIGSNFLDQDGFELCLYSMGVMPLHGYADSEFVFSPALGTNRHFGYGSGLLFQMPLTCDIETCFISFFFEIENIYFFRDTQIRTLDLKSKPWSRYLLLVNRDGTRDIPAVNILTRPVRVRPFNKVDMTTGFRYQSCGVELEAGFDLWARGREDVKLKDCFPCDYGIQGVGFIGNTGVPATASLSTIGVLEPNDVTLIRREQIFVEITEDDIQLNSAAARGAINFRFHLAGGYTSNTSFALLFLGAGCFIEIPNYNTDFKRYGVWAKIGYGF